MKLVSRLGKLVVLMLLAAGSARAATILDVSGAVAASDPTQLGRLSRNGILQDWVGSEPFPGVINPTTLYHYRAYVVNVGITPFVQVNFDSLSLNTFVAAYDTAYLPNSAGAPNFGFDTNWLGDAGVSGNFFGTDPLFFQVLVPLNHNLLIIVANTAAANVGIGDPFGLLVEGFVDSAYTEPGSVVPEPATMLLGAVGLAAVGLRRRRRTGR